jgi:hypothetical protein
MVLIANPIYDVVFKYLLDDNQVAKILLSAIIGHEILELSLTPQEIIGEFGQVLKAKPKTEIGTTQAKRTKKANLSATEFTNLTVYRLDFAAKIRTEEGEKIVIIEIQKAKLMHDILRFRRYLGKQYSDEKNTFLAEKNGKSLVIGIPIISIYFLGEVLDNIKGIPVLKVSNQVTDLHSGEQIDIKEDFIESLTHQSYIISIPDLTTHKRDELENLLSIFDQNSQSKDSKHLLNIADDDLPPKYSEVIRRLQKAAAEAKVRQTMQVEDDFLSEMADYERKIEKKDQLILETKQKLDEEKFLRKQAEREKDVVSKKLLDSEKQKAAAQQKIVAMVQKCFGRGMTVEEIAEFTAVSVAEINHILKNMA